MEAWGGHSDVVLNRHHYAFSTDGKHYHSFGSPYQLTWGSYRGDRIGIFNFNVKEDKRYVDIDWFREYD
ncbi:hypothetical protein [Ohtaekwangia sp.]|uniref:beta-xylosidase family glycoside hydrolase n=1 Tax=Ohtaekwangia sp. TaxID=2066019 RepID=UPI002FDDEEF0